MPRLSRRGWSLEGQPRAAVGGLWPDGTMQSCQGVVRTSRHELELRLSGHSAPNGEINLADLGAIARELQDLATRVGRHVAEQTGTGRSFAAVENASRLRLRSLNAGSVRLAVALGQTGVLDIDDGLEQAVADGFWEIVSGVASDERPNWTPSLVSESVVSLLNALQHAAQTVAVSLDGGAPVIIRPATASRDVWKDIERVEPTARPMTGVLKMVDIEQARFRLRDDVRNSIALHHVAEPERAAGLVGQRVTATGVPIYSTEGKFLRLEAPTIEATALPAEWTTRQYNDVAAIIAAAPGPEPAGMPGFTEEEAEAWHALMHEM